MSESSYYISQKSVFFCVYMNKVKKIQTCNMSFFLRYRVEKIMMKKCDMC